MTRPTFAAAWAASGKIYDPANSGERVARVVGGDVAAHIRDKRNPWRNTCAVRMSYILNEAGVIIPSMSGKTRKGGDHRNYFYRVKDVASFLKTVWGAPQTIACPPSGGGALSEKCGLILFEVHGWSDASGHATLYNGSHCYDACYFNEPGATYRTRNACFWSLK